MGKIILVTGGARSGKSTFAEKYVAKYGHKIGYIATAQICDDEMEFRVKLHQGRRPSTWDTFESPFDAHEIIKAQAGTHDMFLFDCMTIYISNILSQIENIDEFDRIYDLITGKIYKLIDAIKASTATVVIVTNEVGAGIVPESKLARIYRDLSGLANQLLAEASAEVFLVVAGLPVNLRKLRENI